MPEGKATKNGGVFGPSRRVLEWVARELGGMPTAVRVGMPCVRVRGGIGKRSAAVLLLRRTARGIRNARDATVFGANWNGGWANTSLPPKP